MYTHYKDIPSNGKIIVVSISNPNQDFSGNFQIEIYDKPNYQGLPYYKIAGIETYSDAVLFGQCLCTELKDKEKTSLTKNEITALTLYLSEWPENLNFMQIIECIKNDAWIEDLISAEAYENFTNSDLVNAIIDTRDTLDRNYGN